MVVDMSFKKLLVVVVWTPATILSLVASILLLNSYSKVRAGGTLLAYQAKEMFPRNEYQFFAALPQVLGSFTIAIAREDARPEILHQFLQKHNSPFVNYADSIVAASDANQIDFRIITAIGMCESNLGKNMPADSYNAWGFAVYTGEDSGATFKDWDHAIRIMADYLSKKYYNQGLTSPEEIGPIYAPPSINTGNSWAKCVRTYMEELI